MKVKADLLTKGMLAMAILLLGVALIFQFTAASSPSALGTVQYKVISGETLYSPLVAEELLNRNGQEGWELAAVTNNGWMIFKRVNEKDN